MELLRGFGKPILKHFPIKTSTKTYFILWMFTLDPVNNLW
jgi:hypothetical protein